MLFSKLLLALRERINRRGEQLSSLQKQTKLPFVLLVVPTLLKLGLYAMCVQLPTLTNTPLFATAIFVNMVVLELRNHYVLYERKRTLRVQLEKCVALVFLAGALAMCACGKHNTSNNVLFGGCLLLVTVLVQGYLYNTKTLFDLYKPTAAEMLVKQFIMEAIMLFLLALFAVLVGGSF